MVKPRPSPSSRGYDRAWQRLRLQVLREEPWCRMCLKQGKRRSTVVADHIIPVRKRPDLRLVRGNVQGLCKAHHDSEKQQEEKRGYSRRVGVDGWPVDRRHPVYRPTVKGERIGMMPLGSAIVVRKEGGIMPDPIKIAGLTEDGWFPNVNVVGESRYQDNIEAICGGRTKEGEEGREAEAVLVLEDTNKYDPKAVRVDIRGKTVGYLSRESAREYREWLEEMGHPGATVVWPAMIRGGWDRGAGERGHYGVEVDVGPPQEDV